MIGRLTVEPAGTCTKCRHFRRDRGFIAIALVPFVGWILAPWILRDAVKFGRCVNPALRRPFGWTENYASIDREYHCGGKEWDAKRRTLP